MECEYCGKEIDIISNLCDVCRVVMYRRCNIILKNIDMNLEIAFKDANDCYADIRDLRNLRQTISDNKEKIQKSGIKYGTK